MMQESAVKDLLDEFIEFVSLRALPGLVPRQVKLFSICTEHEV